MSGGDQQNHQKCKPDPTSDPVPSGIERFKLEDGREGVLAAMGNGLIKLLFDNGDMAIVMDRSQQDERKPEESDKNQPTPKEPSYPIVAVSLIPTIVEQLSRGQGDPRYAVIMFLPTDSEDGEHVNLQFAVQDGIVGMEWVLLGGRNIQDREGIKEFAACHGHQFMECEMNDVKYLRTVGPELGDLGVKVLCGYYRFEPTTRVQLLAEGFEWPPRLAS